MEAVAWTLRNRAEKREMTLEEVATQPMQFSSMNTSMGQRQMLDLKEKNPVLWKQALNAMEKVSTADMSDDFTGGADHFYAQDLMNEPWWAKKMQKTVTEGGHTFFKS